MILPVNRGLQQPFSMVYLPCKWAFTPSNGGNMKEDAITSNPEDLFIRWEQALDIEMFVLSLGDSLEGKILDGILCGYGPVKNARQIGINRMTYRRRLAAMKRRLAPQLSAKLHGDSEHESTDYLGKFEKAYYTCIPSRGCAFDLASSILLANPGF